MKTLVTTLQTGAQPHRQATDAILNHFIKGEGISKVVFFIADHRSWKVKDEIPAQDAMHWKTVNFINKMRALCEVEVIYEGNVELNSNISCSHSQIVPQAVNPFLGLSDKLSSKSSHIVPSTKVRMITIPSKRGSPRALLATGALTHGCYNERTARGNKAKLEHQYGFVVVETYSETRYSIKQAQVTEKGLFHYRDTLYSNSEPLKKRLSALVIGDIHAETVDTNALDETCNHIGLLNPRNIVVHDLFDAISITPHARDSFFHKLGSQLTLEDELHNTWNVLEDLIHASSDDAVIHIVYSNHDDMLKRYIDSGRFLQSECNALIATEILQLMLKNKIPCLQAAFRAIGKSSTKVKFLKRTDSLIVKGYTLDQHGDKGCNGARGSVMSYNKTNAKSVTGHTHSPMIMSNSACVGHITDVSKQHYAEGGLSSWLQANIGITSSGTIMPIILDSNFI